MAQSPPIDGRGHNADKPSDIPKPGWRSILRRVYTSTSDKNLSVLAAGVAFYGMLSMFPALAVLVAIYGLFADPATVQHEINTIGGLIPGEAQNLIAEYLKSLASSSSSRLGISLLISLLIALWSARAGTVTVIEASIFTSRRRTNIDSSRLAHILIRTSDVGDLDGWCVGGACGGSSAVEASANRGCSGSLMLTSYSNC